MGPEELRASESSMDASGEWTESQRVGDEGGAWVGEDFLAHARLVLAIVCVIAIYLHPALLGSHGKLGALLVLLYLIYSLFNLMILRAHWHYGLAWGLCLHAAEALLISLVVLVTGGPQSPFLGLYLFLFFVAACKWGFKGALLTSGACAAFLVGDLDFPSRMVRAGASLGERGGEFRFRGGLVRVPRFVSLPPEPSRGKSEERVGRGSAH